MSFQIKDQATCAIYNGFGGFFQLKNDDPGK